MKLQRTLSGGDHTVRWIANEFGPGWRVREEEDSYVTRQLVHEDWHHVEMDLMHFGLRAAQLRERGWTDSGVLTAE